MDHLDLHRPRHHISLRTHQSHLVALTTMATPRVPFICARCTQSLRQQYRTFASAYPSHRVSNVKGTSEPSEDLPRWKQTPPAMKMPIRLRPIPQDQPRWSVNDQDEPVDRMYDRFIGERAGASAAGQEGMQGRGIRGSELLDEQIKVRTSKPLAEVGISLLTCRTVVSSDA